MLSKRLIEARKAIGETQNDVARFLNVKRQTYSSYERDVSVPDAITLSKLALHFGVSTDYLLESNDMHSPTMFSEILYKLRVEHQYTQQQVADGSDIEQQTYSLYERGQCTPVVESLIKLSKFYGISVDYLLGLTYEAEEPTPPKSALPPEQRHDISSLTPEGQAKALDYINMLKRIEEADAKNAGLVGTHDISKLG